MQYLGHVISADMKDDLDIMRQCRQLYAQGNALARCFHMCSDNVKVTIFRSYCSSLYTSQLWWKYKVNSIRKLYVAYNNAFRMLFMLPRDCSASGMFAVHNVMSCPALVWKRGFMEQLCGEGGDVYEGWTASERKGSWSVCRRLETGSRQWIGQRRGRGGMSA